MFIADIVPPKVCVTQAVASFAKNVLLAFKISTPLIVSISLKYVIVPLISGVSPSPLSKILIIISIALLMRLTAVALEVTYVAARFFNSL